ncbi:MAG: hypothetical protein ACR2NT_15110 [Acidimicrobiia bacterium]|nr:hypothetical protein [Acidimicrobiia bacterium]
MRFRLGLLIGGAIGYVLGAKAGRGRYEEIRSWFNNVTEGKNTMARKGQSLIDTGWSAVFTDKPVS